MKRIAILHYASAPTIGGVEATMTQHAHSLRRFGYDVRIISGKGAPFPPSTQIEYHHNALFSSSHLDILALKQDLDAGIVPPAFGLMVDRLTADLQTALDGCEVCLAHNIPTLNKNLPLSIALERLSSAGNVRVVAWCHDLAWTNPQYLPELHDGEPWNVLRRRWKNAHYVTVSDARRIELAELLHMPPEEITVIYPGVDLASMLAWTPLMDTLDRRLQLVDADGLLLLPARLTRRKNISLALHVLAALREKSGRDFRLIVTGPPGPHNPTNPGYLGELLDLRRSLGLETSAHFLYESGENDEPLMVDDDTIAALYRTCDALFFPSVQEGFGMPVIEAGVAGLPVFCADIPPLRASGGEDAYYFDPQTDSAETIAVNILTALDNDARFRLRVRTRHAYRWDTIIQRQLLPILESR